MNEKKCSALRFALPKGRMQEGVFRLLDEAGISVSASARGYRPVVSIPNIETKILKPQNIVDMLQLGSRDLGFAGQDWCRELGSKANDPNNELVEVLNTGLNPVRLVAAAPENLLVGGQLPDRRLRVASEYESLTRQWIAGRSIDAQFVRSNGATEVFPPEDADLIIDNTSTGATLRDNGLVIVDELMQSSTCLYASREAWQDECKRPQIEDLKLLLQAVLEGRRRNMIEVNVSAQNLDQVINVLPAMQKPTVSPLFEEAGYAVRAAILRTELPAVIPQIKASGGRDIVVSELNQIIP